MTSWDSVLDPTYFAGHVEDDTSAWQSVVIPVGADEQVVEEAVSSVSPETPTVYTFALDDLVGYLKTRGRPTDPCPWCVRLHTIGLADTPSKPSMGPTEVNDSNFNETAIKRSRAHWEAMLDREEECLLRLASLEAGSAVTTSTIHKHPACQHQEVAVSNGGSRRARMRRGKLDYEFFDPKVGIIRSIEHVGPDYTTSWDDLDMSVSVCWIAHPAYHQYPDATGRHEIASAGGRTRSASTLRAIMEGIERYAAFVQAPIEREGAAANMDCPLVPGDRFYHYAPEQYDREGFPFDPYDPETVYNWVECRDLHTGDSRWIPEDLVYLSPSRTRSSFLVDNTTNGCAAHFSRLAARRNALLELVERHALMRFWYDQEPRPHLRVDSLPADLRSQLAPLGDTYDIHLIDVTVFDALPCFEVVLTSPDAVPAAVVGGGAGTTRREALSDAIEEALSLLISATTDGSRAAIADSSLSAADVSASEDHLKYYAHPDHLDNLSGILEPASFLPFRDTSNSTQPSTVREVLAERNISVFCRDITPGTLSSSYDLTVVRVLSPDLLPLTFGHGFERVTRESSKYEYDELPDVPHPFA